MNGLVEEHPSLNAPIYLFPCQLTSIYLLYPYRDYVKTFSYSASGYGVDGDYFVVRYKGMALNPHQPLLLALPWTVLYASTLAAGGGVAGAVSGGVAFATVKLFVRKLAHRMTFSHKRSGSYLYQSTMDCISKCTRERGAFSWFSGLAATSLIAIAWHGAALKTLCERRQEPRIGLFDDLFTATMIHASAALMTTPLRNAFRSGLYDAERSGGVKGIRDFVAGERAVFVEAAGVTRHAFRNTNFRFFFEGALRTVFKTSLPFGVTFAMYRGVGGILPGHGHARGYHHSSHRRRL